MNDKGFWENSKLLQINEHLLETLNLKDKLQRSNLYDLAEKLYEALKVSDDAVISELQQQYKFYLDGLDLVLLKHIKLVKQSEVHFITVFEQAYYSRFGNYSVA